MKRIMFILGCVLALFLTGFSVMQTAQATEGDGGETPCVPQDGYTETTDWVLVSPGDGWNQIDERVVVDSEAYDEEVLVSEAVPEVWANFQPTKPKTFVGPPSYPSDPRGKWTVHDKIPGGHAGPDGVYSKGNLHKGGNWFFRQAGKDAVYETVHHEAVTHKEFKFSFEHPAVDCPPTEEPPVDPEEPTEEPPVEEPETPVNDEPKITTESSCVGDALVVKTYEDGVAVSTDTKNGAARCAVGTVDGPEEAPREEGF